jgi:hypothetical protein
LLGAIFVALVLTLLFYADALLNARVVSPTERDTMDKMRNEAIEQNKRWEGGPADKTGPPNSNR